MTMKQPNKTSNVGILIKAESIANPKQNVDNDTKIQSGDSGVPDCTPEESSTSKPVSNIVKLKSFTPKLPKINAGREERHKMEREKSDLIHGGGVERAPTWLTERSIHRDGVNRYNTQLVSRAYHKPGYGRHNTAFLSDYGSDAGVYSRVSQYEQFVEDYQGYEDSEEEEDDESLELAIVGLSTASPTRDMVSLDKPRRKTADLTDKQTAQQVYGGYNSRLPHRLGSFEKGRETKVYKRTRHHVKDMKKVRQWPAGLELSGKGMTDDDVIPPIKVGTENESVGQPDDVSVTESNRLPPLSENIAFSPRSNTKLSFSSSFFSDYGLRSNKTDSFSGYKRGRMKTKSASEAHLEKELQAKAERHIYACHVLSSVRRGSKAAQNFSSFRQTIGPNQRSIRPVSELSPPKPMHRHFNSSPDKAGHLYETAKKSPVAFYIKTRDSTDLSRARMKTADGLPEINGRTLILGMVNK